MKIFRLLIAMLLAVSAASVSAQTYQIRKDSARQEQVQQVGKRDPPACEPDRSRHLPDVRTYSRSLRTDVGLLSLNKIPSKSVKNEQKALANPANRIN